VRYTCVRVNGTSQKFFPRYGDQWLRSKRGTIYKARIEDCKDFCERHYVMRRGGDR
jgi:ribosomal protein L37AE/L43A